MSNNTKDIIQQYNKTKEYIASLGYELGYYDFKKGKNIIFGHSVSSDGCHKIIGYIKSGDFNSLEVCHS